MKSPSLGVESREASALKTAGEGTQKLLVLESIRGIAAFAVFNYHFIDLFARQLWSAPFRVMVSSTLGAALAATQVTPLNVLVNSELAVRTFFVLSGFVLSYRFFIKRDDAIPRVAALKRAIRLAVPISASLVVSFVVFRFISSHEALLQIGPVFDTTMMQQDVKYPPRAWDVVTQSVKVMFTGVTFRTLNRSLWTMQHELVGSYVVFCFLILFGVIRHRWLLYLAVGAAALLMGQPYVIDFLVGMAISDFTARVPAESRAGRRLRAWALLSLALGLGYMMLWFPLLDHGWRIYELFQVGPAIAAGFVVFGAVYATRVHSWLSLRPIVFFGRISFASYLLHLSVIYGVGGWIFKWTYDATGSHATAFVAGYAVSLMALLGAATAFTRYVDEPAIALSRWVANTVAGEKS